MGRIGRSSMCVWDFLGGLPGENNCSVQISGAPCQSFKAPRYPWFIGLQLQTENVINSVNWCVLKISWTFSQSGAPKHGKAYIFCSILRVVKAHFFCRLSVYSLFYYIFFSRDGAIEFWGMRQHEGEYLCNKNISLHTKSPTAHRRENNIKYKLLAWSRSHERNKTNIV